MSAPDLGRFRVYYWDTFEEPGEDTHLASHHDTLEAAQNFVLEKYKVSADGADQVEIVDHVTHDVIKYSVSGTK